MAFDPKKPGSLGRVSFSIPIRVGVFGLIGSCCIAYVYHCQREYRETMTFFATCLGGTAAITGTFYAGQALRQNALEKRLDRTLLYIEKWSDPSFDSVRKAGRQVHDELEAANGTNTNHDKLIEDMIQRDGSLSISINNALNFFEDIANSIELGVVDEQILCKYYRGIMSRHYDLFSVWIAKLRNNAGVGGNSKTFKAYTDLCEKWVNSQNDEVFSRSFSMAKK
jgi:hypothetical protein